MKNSNHINSNRLWNDTLHEVLVFATDQINNGSGEIDDMLKTLQLSFDGTDTKKPPDEEAIIKEETVDLTVQFNQLASVHNMDTINEAAGIIRDIISA